MKRMLRSVERPAMDGRAGARHQGRFLASNFNEASPSGSA
jgi:hypothetical protein